jgi:hypothetical protein
LSAETYRDARRFFRVYSDQRRVPEMAMHRLAIRAPAASLLLLFLAMLQAPFATAQDKPLLSQEVRRVIEERGVPAAKARFAEIYPSQQDRYEIDMQGMLGLIGEFMSAGNTDASQAAAEMMATINQDMIAALVPALAGLAEPPAVSEQARQTEQALQAASRAEEERSRQNVESQARGRARDDLARFTGIYGAPADRARTRTLFAAVSCDGYLITGPNWADVAPWWMRSAADTVFTYSDSFQSLSMEFQTDDNGQAQRLSHDIDGLASPLQRLDPLPDEWPASVERPQR